MIQKINDEWGIERPSNVLVHNCGWPKGSWWMAFWAENGEVFVCHNNRCEAFSPREITDVALLARVKDEK